MAENYCMSIFEYDQEKHYRQLELDAIETGMERGMRQGMQQGLLDLLEEKGDIPAGLRE